MSSHFCSFIGYIICERSLFIIFDLLTLQVTMADAESAKKAIQDPNPVIDGRKANVNLAYLGAKPRGVQGIVFHYLFYYCSVVTWSSKS